MSNPLSGGENPLLDGLRIEPTPETTALVIFGASGDLTRRKLLPALYHLSRGQRLPARFAIIGVARSPMTDEAFRQQFHDSLKEFANLASPDDFSTQLAHEMRYIQA
jgi:glucose-6-phosphate 1-dehydrogenase